MTDQPTDPPNPPTLARAVQQFVDAVIPVLRQLGEAVRRLAPFAPRYRAARRARLRAMHVAYRRRRRGWRAA